MGFVAALVTISAGAQTPPPARPQMYVVHEEVARPGMIPEFEGAARELFAAFAEQKADPAVMGVHVYKTTDFHYFFIAPISGFGGLERLQEGWKGVAHGIGASRWAGMNARGDRTLSSFNQFVIVLQPELSYVPAAPRLKPEERRLEHWKFFHLQPGSEDEAESIAHALAALYREKNVGDGFTIFTVPMGHDLPLIIVSTSAGDAQDRAAEEQRVNTALASELAPLRARMVAITRRLEEHDAVFRPDLSYPAIASGTK